MNTRFDDFIHSFVNSRRAFVGILMAMIVTVLGDEVEAKRNRKNNRDRVSADKRKRNPCKKKRRNGKRRNKPDGTACPGGTCQSGVCVSDPGDPCLGTNCPACQRCQGGQCVPANEGETCGGCNVCTNGACVAGSCPNDGEVCQEGDCICPSGETCTYKVSSGELRGFLIEDEPANNGTVPYQFVASPSSVGSGSLEIGPIDGTNPKNKLVMRLPVDGMDVADLLSVDYDFFIAASSPGGANDKVHFYVNVYVDDISNGLGFFGSGVSSSGFYDCRYDLIPTSGTIGDWSTNGFDQTTSTWTNIANRTGTCPNALSGFAPGSKIIRAQVNVGDTSASDAGVKGNFDNIVIESPDGISIFDF